MSSFRLAALPILFALVGCPGRSGSVTTAPDPSAASAADVADQARAAIEAWRQAWEERSIETLRGLYQQDLDVAVVAQGRAFLGWTAVDDYLTMAVSGAREVRIRLDALQVIALGDRAAAAVATLRRDVSDGVSFVADQGTLTMVLRAQGGTWVIASEHYSYPPSVQ
jgi:ketosteroid isomerase-like protein